MVSNQNTEPFVLRWGIIGTGLIASWFVSDLVCYPNGEKPEDNIRHVVQAVASASSLDKATAFTQKHLSACPTKPTVYGSYEQLYADPEVDIVYIATPHAAHMRNTLDSINAGKHVLCEKPMAINAKQAAIMMAAAHERGVYLMEGVWTRFFPLAHKFRNLIHAENAIGTPTRAFFDFGLDMPLDKANPASRLRDIRLGAGSLLDIGIYPLTWAAIAIHGSPCRDKRSGGNTEYNIVSALSLNGGVDETSTIVLTSLADQTQAICTSTYLHKTREEFGRVEGTAGSLHILGRAASKPRALVLRRNGEEEKVLNFDFDGWGFFYEADAVAKDIRDGKKESERIPLVESLRILELIDRVRQQGNVVYPQDSI